MFPLSSPSKSAAGSQLSFLAQVRQLSPNRPIRNSKSRRSRPISSNRRASPARATTREASKQQELAGSGSHVRLATPDEGTEVYGRADLQLLHPAQEQISAISEWNPLLVGSVTLASIPQARDMHTVVYVTPRALERFFDGKVLRQRRSRGRSGGSDHQQTGPTRVGVFHRHFSSAMVVAVCSRLRDTC